MSTLLLNKKFSLSFATSILLTSSGRSGQSLSIGVDVASTSYSNKTCLTTSSASQSTKPSAKVYACSGLGPIATNHKANNFPNLLNPRADDAKYYTASKFQYPKISTLQ